MSNIGQGLPRGGVPQAGNTGAQDSIMEATETLQQIHKLHLDEPKAPPPGAPVTSSATGGDGTAFRGMAPMAPMAPMAARAAGPPAAGGMTNPSSAPPTQARQVAGNVSGRMADLDQPSAVAAPVGGITNTSSGPPPPAARQVAGNVSGKIADIAQPSPVPAPPASGGIGAGMLAQSSAPTEPPRTTTEQPQSRAEAPPPLAEALAPIADDSTPPPPADPVPQDVKEEVEHGSAGFPPVPRDAASTGSTGTLRRDDGANQGGSMNRGGGLDRDATATAAGGDTVQDDGNEGGQGGILSTIGSYFGIGSSPDSQDVEPTPDAGTDASGKPINSAPAHPGGDNTGRVSHAGTAAGAAGAGGAAAGLGAAMAMPGNQGVDGAGSGSGMQQQQQGGPCIGGTGGSGTRQQQGGPAAGSSAMASQSAGQPGGYEWLADLLEKMWPYITEAVNKEAANQLPPLIKASKPTWMGDITLHKFKLGGKPPALTDIRVVKDPGAKGLQGDDYIHLEVDFDWDSSQDVEMDVSIIPDKMKFLPNFMSKAISKATSFRCGIENFEMFGDLMVSFRPVMHQLPIVGAIQVSFTEAPDFDFDITMGTAGAKVLDALPMLKNFLYGFISDTLLAPYILPDHYFYAIDPAAPDYSIPVGYVEVEVVEGKNVPKMDYFTSTSPYVQVSTHKRGAKQTKVASKARHPHWGETFKLPIMVPKYQHITAVLYDEDYGGDDEVGRVMYAVKDLQPNNTQDMWLPVKPLLKQDKGDEEEDKKKGRKKRDKIKSALTRPLGPADPQHKGTSLHLRMTYRECTEDQVRAVMEAEQHKTPIRDSFMAELLKEDEPTGVVAGDRAKQANPTQPNAQDTDAEKQQKAERGEPQVVTKDGVQLLEQRARPGSASAEVAATGEVR